MRANDDDAEDARTGGGDASNARENETMTTTCGDVNARDGLSGGTAVAQGVPEAWDEDAFKSWLRALGVRFGSAKKRRRWAYGFVTFGDVSDRVDGQGVMEDASVNGRRVRVKQANVRGKGGRNAEEGAEGVGRDARDVVARVNAFARRDIRDVITPMWRASYGEQLHKKREIVAESLREITRGTRNACTRAKKSGQSGRCDWLRDAFARDKLCCPLDGIVRSPVLDGYRNKSEFTIGLDPDGEITCGFNVGSFRDGVIAVAPPVGCRNISETAKYLGDATQTYLRARAKEGLGLPAYDKRNASGFWRLFLCREGGMAPASEHGWEHWLRPGTGPPKPSVEEQSGNANDNNADPSSQAVEPFEYPNEEDSLPAPLTNGENSEVMVMFQVRTEGYSDEQIREECDGARDAVFAAAAAATPPINVKVMLVQFHNGVSNMAPENAEIRDMRTFELSEKSKDVIHERMCGLQFSLSATAFFQVNTLAAEALYRLAGEWASPSGKSLLLDVCCGTGTIGLTLARDVKKVVGVDIVEESIKDAFVNAKLNGVENTDWLAGKAEAVIPKLLNDYKSLIKPLVTEQKTVPISVLDDPDLSADEDTEAAIRAAAAASTTPVDGNYEYEDVVAIVDPPRGGLHKSVLSALRRENRLKRLVYVSCNSSTMAKNVIDLCVPQGFDGNGGGVPFRPVKALALDLFPHTQHVEAVLLLER